MAYRSSPALFGSLQRVTYTLIVLNAIVFCVCLLGNSFSGIDASTLFFGGALYNGALDHGDYWRLVAYAFLHANVMHFGLNMLCIAAWSGPLEERLGATFFLIVYLASAIGGGLASLYGHSGPYLGVGASGAISGILGGLLGLTLLGKISLAAPFFLVTIGLNAVLGASSPGIDWQAHLGGLFTGFATVAVLEAFERINGRWLRCKFPEFVKMALLVLIGIGAVFILNAAPAERASYAIAWGGAALVLIKITDLVLLRPKGLAMAAFGAALLYGLAPVAISRADKNFFPDVCERGLIAARVAEGGLFDLCQSPYVLPLVLGLGLLGLTLYMLRSEIKRGLNDMGFIAASLKAARNRARGL